MNRESVAAAIEKEKKKQIEIERLLRWHEFRLSRSIERENRLTARLREGEVRP